MQEEEGGINRIESPDTLDVVEYNGKRYQVISTGKDEQGVDLTVLVQLDKSRTKTIRVRGAKFERLKETLDPGSGRVHARDEGVRFTGKLEGGSIDDD